MTSETFQVQIITSRKHLLSSEASEVVLPAFDGEIGILPQHEHFIGTLGTGTLKVVREGEDFWFAICEGVFEISKSTLKILAREAIEAENVDKEQTASRLKTLESSISQMSSYCPEFEQLKSQIDYLRALLEAHRRHALVH